MSKFFIDSDDGDQQVIDGEGFEMPHADAARKAARQALHDMARDHSELFGRRTFTVSVRDAGGGIVYWAALTFEGGTTLA